MQSRFYVYAFVALISARRLRAPQPRQLRCQILVSTDLHPPSTRWYLSFFVSRLIMDAASLMDTDNGRNKKRLHQLASLIIFRSTTPTGALQTRSRGYDSPIPATRCCVVVERASWRRQPTPRQQPSFFPSLQLFLLRYGKVPYLLTVQ